METNKKYIAVVSRLNRLTQEGTITWKSSKVPEGLTAGTNNIVNLFYSAQYEEKNIGIYEERYEAYDSDHDETYWTTRLVLAFFSNEWTEEWIFPPLSGILELLNSVKYQSSGVDDFFNKILQDEKRSKTTLREATRGLKGFDLDKKD